MSNTNNPLYMNLDMFIEELLHINDGAKNKLIDLEAGDLSKTYYLNRSDRESISRYILTVIRSRIGMPGNTAMLRSALDPDKEQRIGKDINSVEWVDAAGNHDSSQLHKYIASVYKELSLKGNNPLFLSVGALNWEVAVRRDEIKKVKTPFLIFPIRLVRTGNSNTPIYIEFINDDIYINPCLVAKLSQLWGEDSKNILKSLPHPSGEGIGLDEPVDLEKLGNGEEYFRKVVYFIDAQRQSDDTVFSFEPDTVAISQYNHGELCMYYDIKRHRDEIYSSPLSARIFEKHDTFPPSPPIKLKAQCILPHDSTQERMISRVVNGESLIIKGPPGTGKTLTITNMIAALMAANKKVILSSQKPAAMFEVVAKMPEPLRKFVMLLDCETEAQAAALNPSEFRKELTALLNTAKSFKPQAGIYDDLSSSNLEKQAAENEIAAYTRMMFEEKDIIGYSYYEALDVLSKIDAKPVLFGEPEVAYGLSRTKYNELLSDVSAAAEHFAAISDGHTIEKCPWYPTRGTLINVDLDAAYSDYSKISDMAKALIAAFKTVCNNANIRAGELSLGDAIVLLSNRITKEAMLDIADPRNGLAISKLRAAYEAYSSNKLSTAAPAKVKEGAENLRALVAGSEKWDLTLDAALLRSVYESWSAIEMLGDIRRLPFLLDFIKFHQTENAKIDAALEEIYSVFRKEIFADNATGELMRDAYSSFSGYDMTKNPKAPAFFDFKGKKCFAAMQTLGYGDSVSFADAVKAVTRFAEVDSILSSLEQKKAEFSSKFTHKFTDEEISVILKLVEHILKNGAGATDYIVALGTYKDDAHAALSSVECKPGATLANAREAILAACALDILNDAIDEITSRSEAVAALGLKPIALAKTVLAISRVLKDASLGATVESSFNTIDRLACDAVLLVPDMQALVDALLAFAAKHFESYYTARSLRVSFNELEIFVKEATDKSIIHAQDEYLRILYSDNVFELDRFFRPFENGSRELGAYSFTEHFEHSVFNLAVTAKQKRMGDIRYGLGDHITRKLTEWETGDKKSSEATLQLIEQQCISRIRTDDPAFAFLGAERASNDTLRRIFKNNAEEILKLKKCFILSPSSVSLFFGRPEFSDFDVVIVDEASQLTPTSILPVLFRTKQVVLVGDEWQMPPIKHFSTSTLRQMKDEDGEIVFMNPDTSVLSLALNNCAFPAEKLSSHYRSRTESLISFSQGRFYDYMRTFPTTIPKREGLGFKDIYLPDGYSQSAINAPEAEAVIKELELHFESYFRDGRLSESVGVVAFGEKQVEYIKDLVRNNDALNSKIETAISNYDDLAEKLIFFKTIETVQGQEIDHLILSLTYGKNKDGKAVQAFGELNRGSATDKLGQCIFNVAVTRAKSSITVIHSVRAEELTNDSIDFIADYLRVARRFSLGGRDQFVGQTVEQTPRGFLRQVAEYIVSLGIDAERVVINFGATEGSVRIPIAILSPDKSEALLGVWCETDQGNDYDYLDYNLRYFRVLEGGDRAWKLHRIYIHDWVDNNEAAKKELAALVSGLV